MVPVELLKRMDVFEGLTEEDLRKIAAIAEERTYDAGQMIFAENDMATKLFLVQEGRVAIQFALGDRRRATVQTVGKGHLVGWSALVEPYRFTASAVAVVPSRLIAVDGQGLQELFQADCRLGFIIMHRLAVIISERLRDTRLQLISLYA